MGFSSCFTLYRKYNTKASDADFADVLAKYVKYNKDHDYSDNKKSDAEYAKDIPQILDPQYTDEESSYDEKTGEWIDIKDHTIIGQRKNFQYIFVKDHSNLDEMLTWSFCSDFNCLVDEFGMCRIGINKYDYVIDRHTAEMMLQACNYLLAKKWSDEIEDILDNKWIKIFAEGNSSNSYWKYVYRNNKKRLNEILEDGESDSIEFIIKRVKCALETYLQAEVNGYGKDAYEYILVYSAG